MTNNLIEIKFHGGGINPSAIKASEVAELINAFEKSIVATVHENYPELDVEKYAYLSFQSIKNESLGLGFAAINDEDAYSDAHLKIAYSINSNDYNNLPYLTIENLKVVSKFSKKHNCVCDYILNSEKKAELTPATVIEINKNTIIKGETTIYGKIERVGGAEPRIVFKDHADNKIYFEVTEDIAKQLAAKLYEEIALTGTATWDKKTYRVVDFKVTGITDLNKKSLIETFTEIQDIISNNWEEFDDIETIIN